MDTLSLLLNKTVGTGPINIHICACVSDECKRLFNVRFLPI